MQDINYTNVVSFVFSYMDEDWFTIYANNVTEAILKAREYSSVDTNYRVKLTDIIWDYNTNIGWIYV